MDHIFRRRTYTLDPIGSLGALIHDSNYLPLLSLLIEIEVKEKNVFLGQNLLLALIFFLFTKIVAFNPPT